MASTSLGSAGTSPVHDLDDVEVTRDVEARMRDGTILRADIYRPRVSGALPVLVSRTPYDKSRAKDQRTATILARAGYIVVVQDIRGRNASDGEWNWHMTFEGARVESDDGYDTCEWVATLDGSNGTVGVYGSSYPGWCAWRMAAAQPPSLRALFTSGIAVRTTDTTYGVFETGIRLRWQHQMAVSSRRRVGDFEYPRTVEEAKFAWDQIYRGKWLWRLPLEAIPDELYGPTATMQKQYWRDIAVDFWALDRIHPLVRVPTCTLTGWWDRLSGAAEHFSGMVANGPAETRDQHRLIIGPWIHDVVSTGESVHPASRGHGAIDFTGHLVEWFDHHLKGVRNDLASGPPVRLFLLNESGWRHANSWPPESATTKELFLHSGGNANTPRGDGELNEHRPGDEPPDRYVYDPLDPVMSLPDTAIQLTACDQTPLAGRKDILVYQTPPLEEDVVVVGPVSLRLWVASDCPDTDFVARLIEVAPDGLAVNVSHGMIRARYRQGYDREVMLEPDEPTELTIRMLIAGIRFRRGSRIRVDVTSSDFPSFDRNHNTGKPFYSDAETQIAHQTVFHDRKHPSCLVLSVLPE